MENGNNCISSAVYVYGKDKTGKWHMLVGQRTTKLDASKYLSGGKLNAPVGMREPFEKDIKDCAVREVMEETGLEINKEDLVLYDIENWGPGKSGANFFLKLKEPIENYEVKANDIENDYFKWLPMDSSDFDKREWAFGMNGKAKDIYNSRVIKEHRLYNIIKESIRKELRGYGKKKFG